MEIKRKTKTSSAVKNRYNAKHYKRYSAAVKIELYEKLDKYLKDNNLSKSKFLEIALENLEQKNSP